MSDDAPSVPSSGVPVRLHRSPRQISTDDAPMWTVQFENHMLRVGYEAVELARVQWNRWWRNAYVINVLQRRVPLEALTAVIRYREGEDVKLILKETRRSLPWLDRWDRQLENFVRFSLMPVRDRPKHFSDTL